MAKWNAEEKRRMERLIATVKITHTNSWYKKHMIDPIVKNYDRYKKVSDETGIPVAFIALTHGREGGSDVKKFATYLGNGQPLNKVTTWVPKGRGPFQSWEQGAIDALTYDKVDKVTGWDLPKMLYTLEKYNGFGYRSRGVNTPYVWNWTNHYTSGHFYADHKYSSTRKDGNIGCFALYKLLVQADSRFAVGDVSDSKVVEMQEPAPKWEGTMKSILDAIFAFIVSIFGTKKQNSPKAEEPKEPAGSESRNFKLLSKAATQNGVLEVKGRGSNKIIEEYHRYSTVKNDKGMSDDVPWCASFICWVLEMVGMGSTNSKMARSYEKWGRTVPKSKAVAGDIGVFYRNGKSSGQGHVAILLKIQGDYGYFLGGNQNDSVNITRYWLGSNSSKGFLSFRRSSKQFELTAAQEYALKELAQKIMDGEKVEEAGKVT